MITITVQQTGTSVEDQMQAITKATTKESGTEAENIIKERVGRGLNIKDQLMDPYSAMATAERKKRGRQTAVRDLSLSGRMMAAMQASRVSESGGVFTSQIRFTDALSARKAEENQERDEWFGLSPNDERLVRDFMQDILDQEVQLANSR